MHIRFENALYLRGDSTKIENCRTIFSEKLILNLVKANAMSDSERRPKPTVIKENYNPSGIGKKNFVPTGGKPDANHVPSAPNHTGSGDNPPPPPKKTD